MSYSDQSDDTHGNDVDVSQGYEEDREFAWYAINLGYSRCDYEELTPRDKMFIRKAYEDKAIIQSTLLRDSVLNALGNVLRKKGKSFIELWRKVETVDPVDVQHDMALIEEIEQKEGDWVARIYEANGWRKPST